MFVLAATQFSDLDHYALIAIFILVLFLVLFGAYGRWGGPRA